jgi:hypothetical protein
LSMLSLEFDYFNMEKLNWFNIHARLDERIEGQIYGGFISNCSVCADAFDVFVESLEPMPSPMLHAYVPQSPLDVPDSPLDTPDSPFDPPTSPVDPPTSSVDPPTSSVDSPHSPFVGSTSYSL